MDLDKAIRERHSVRRFKTKKPNWRKIIEAVEAAALAPLAGNIPSVKFILVSDPEKIAELAEAAQQDFIATASYVIVVCTDKEQTERSYGEDAERYTRQQAGAAIENFFLKITALGLSTCWVGSFSETTVRNTLRIPEEVNVEVMLPIGLELNKVMQRKKPHLDDILFFDEWMNKHMKSAPGMET